MLKSSIFKNSVFSTIFFLIFAQKFPKQFKILDFFKVIIIIITQYCSKTLGQEIAQKLLNLRFLVLFQFFYNLFDILHQNLLKKFQIFDLLSVITIVINISCFQCFFLSFAHEIAKTIFKSSILCQFLFSLFVVFSKIFAKKCPKNVKIMNYVIIDFHYCYFIIF